MRPFFFCVCPEFLGALAQFFTSPVPTTPDVDEAGRTSASSNKAAPAKKKPAGKTPFISISHRPTVSPFCSRSCGARKSGRNASKFGH